MLTIPLFFEEKVKYQMRELDISDISKYAQKIIFQNTNYMETFWKFQFDINSSAPKHHFGNGEISSDLFRT